MADALIALGGNIGDVRETFHRAILDVCTRANATLIARSSDYRTPPWGDTQQPDFINACIRIATALAPLELLAVLQDVETAFGRNRKAGHRYGPRTLDLDLLAYDDVRMTTPELELPHPRLFERAFVLVPLAEIAPDRSIAGQTPEAALKRLSREGIDRLPDSAAP
jgi:2-amino-4-hydroxy-6-hydroxymethyldihydropteridine diphosphokinase